MTETTRRRPSSPSVSPSAPYYGLATQLRTPPTDFSPSFPMVKSGSAASNSKKLTPAMRDEFGFAPKFVPQWSSKGEQRAKSRDEDFSLGGGGENHEGSPSLAAIRSSPKQLRTSGRHSTAPRPHHTPHASISTTSKVHRTDSLRDTPVFGKVDFNFRPMQQPLDLTVTLDPVSTPTYQNSQDVKSQRITEEEPAPLSRTGSVPSRTKSLRQNDKSSRSPALEAATPQHFQAPPSPASRPPPPTLPDSFAAAFPLSRTITPAAKGTMNLITLARRTTHLADVPGYGWRLNLLEKLEVLTGSFVAVRDAESILSIGKTHQTSAPNSSKLESRKSQIFLPEATKPDATKLTKSRASRAKADESKSFFGKMRRALSNPGAPQAKEVAPPMPPPKRVVFGQKLSQVAEYGFVTSMIAGQRHDLPGVCFSTVEEIYRRGQGSKVPGLLQLAGEPGRVARLVQIFDAGPDYGEHHDLSVESIHNVCSLLKKYLHDLPEPVLDERVYRLFLAGCVDSTNPLPRRVASAQIILRLLPTTNFSLLVYLVAFLSQIPLFPSNPLSLSVVSEIFASSIMAPRKNRNSTHSTSSGSMSRKTRGQMIITGPTDLVDDQDGKKAKQALEWLLTNWSAVADGLLEPDFDVDVDAVVEPASNSLQLPEGSSPPMIPLSPALVGAFNSPSSPRAAPTPPAGPFPSTFAPPVPTAEPRPLSAVKESTAPSSDDIPRYLDTLEDDDEDDTRSDDERANDSSATKTPRPQSTSSYATSIETPPTQSAEDRRGSRKILAPVHVTPEDERGPLEFPEGTTGDDVVEFDDYSSVYSFPAPPTSLPASTYQHHRLPSLPPSPFLTQAEIALALAEQDKAVQQSTSPSATIHQSSTFAPLVVDELDGDEADALAAQAAEDLDLTEDLDVTAMAPTTVPHLASAPIVPDEAEEAEAEEKAEPDRPRSGSHLVRSEPRVEDLVAQQRAEIESLSDQLARVELERARERDDMAALAREVAAFKHTLADHSAQVDVRTELDHARSELRASLDARERERATAQAQVANLERQLAEIRNVLVPLLGSAVQL
ncbi:hypothetical protein JCM11491_006359 [Sporobolomyces phaffii]